LGIGLAVVRRLVELHGGRVRATSSGLGHGSQFVMSLPLTRPATGETASASPVCAKRLRVCVVEDITAVAWMMRKLLETLGHEVMMAPDGERGIELILERCPDVVFLDIGLPGLNGYEVAEHIRSDPRCREITLVALTGYGQPDERQRAFDAGFKYHFVKPISLASLQACLVEIANQGP
jgi:CheY-like chemotaxis protein